MLRTADAHTPSLTTGDVIASLTGYVIVYAIIYSFGLFDPYRLLRNGPSGPEADITPGRTSIRRSPKDLGLECARATLCSA